MKKSLLDTFVEAFWNERAFDHCSDLVEFGESNLMLFELKSLKLFTFDAFDSFVTLKFSSRVKKILVKFKWRLEDF